MKPDVQMKQQDGGLAKPSRKIVTGFTALKQQNHEGQGMEGETIVYGGPLVPQCCAAPRSLR